MLVTSRSFAEYEAMFDLPTPLPGSILDCCAGASGFTAIACNRGVDAIAVDPAYELSDAELAATLRQDRTAGTGLVDQHAGDFVWHWYGSRENRDRMRAEAAEIFLADRAANPQRYVAAALPRLPFDDRRFELALCSHLLFTWSDQFDADWHLAALRELARVAVEVRVFPLVVQGNGLPVPFLGDVREQLAATGIGSAIRQVPYEFQRGADRMLVASAGAAP